MGNLLSKDEIMSDRISEMQRNLENISRDPDKVKALTKEFIKVQVRTFILGFLLGFGIASILWRFLATMIYG